jgi:hypothetical protein
MRVVLNLCVVEWRSHCIPPSYVTGYNGGMIALYKKPGGGVPIEGIGYMGHLYYYSVGNEFNSDRNNGQNSPYNPYLK